MLLKSFSKFILLMNLFFTISISSKEPSVVLITLDDISFPIVFTTKLDTTKQKYLDAINQARSKTQDCGYEGIKSPVAPLKWNTKLYNAAYMHSNDLAETNTFSHTGSGTQSDLAAQKLHPDTGSTAQERIEYTGYQWSWLAENIAVGQTTIEDVMTAWLNSPGHCANIMDANLTEVGMAHVIKVDSEYTDYWTQDFATAE